MKLVSKSRFAELCNVDRSAVSKWIASGLLSGEALVGQGRSARINVDVARAQLSLRRDVGQALGNGLKTRLRGETPPSSRPAPSAGETSSMHLRRHFLAGAVSLAHGLPAAVATHAHDVGLPRADAERLEMAVRTGMRRELALLFYLYGVEADLTMNDIWNEAAVETVNWDDLAGQ